MDGHDKKARLQALGIEDPVALAPLAGITDLPFRNLVQRFGAGLVVSEMVASKEMVQEKASVRDRAELGANVEGTSVQIAGREAYWMAEAARVVEAQGARRIDINMGCPAKKVTSGLSGAALMRDLDNAQLLVEAVVGAVDIPVTLKMRLGWDETQISAPELAQRAENSGVQMVTVHGRTRCQFYKGQADWHAISRVVEAVSLPVLANGDIVCAETARLALKQSGADGIMIGRGAQGRPWLLANVIDVLFSNTNCKRKQKTPSKSVYLSMVTEHYADMLSFYGKSLGARVARKHLGWYMDTAQTPKDLRKKVLTAEPSTVFDLLPAALEKGPVLTHETCV